MKKAIIVPGVTDLNKGDQAIVWESHRLIKDTGCFDEIFIISTGDTKAERRKLCSQTEEKGYTLIENILKHPRRGKHNEDNIVNESIFSFFKLEPLPRDPISVMFSIHENVNIFIQMQGKFIIHFHPESGIIHHRHIFS